MAFVIFAASDQLQERRRKFQRTIERGDVASKKVCRIIN